MKPEIFELVKLALQILLMALSVLCLPALRRLIENHTTEKQRRAAQYWIEAAIQAAEKMFQEKGQGKSKKSFVQKWLKEQKVPITEEQADILIDVVVEEFNKNGWFRKGEREKSEVEVNEDDETETVH